ncbi:uncharacterized protein BJ212DRAFT_1304852 [Suillus subaureus]|uniref:Uncharacterized protein n=1 Tax=Suillus subaureus TaxID=48587 RepID=A0A9P7DSY7_9AGAM|nr:uncharacterized protein BJ212DRAFT_1304852 [Suillus subaureus]KAG1802382.1 hypothetical protein BJ212DRAFT_1304852 [Suillus subaureus]
MGQHFCYWHELVVHWLAQEINMVMGAFVGEEDEAEDVTEQLSESGCVFHTRNEKAFITYLGDIDEVAKQLFSTYNGMVDTVTEDYLEAMPIYQDKVIEALQDAYDQQETIKDGYTECLWWFHTKVLFSTIRFEQGIYKEQMIQAMRVVMERRLKMKDKIDIKWAESKQLMKDMTEHPYTVMKKHIDSRNEATVGDWVGLAMQECKKACTLRYKAIDPRPGLGDGDHVSLPPQGVGRPDGVESAQYTRRVDEHTLAMIKAQTCNSRIAHDSIIMNILGWC